jgi:hypothetical protein
MKPTLRSLLATAALALTATPRAASASCVPGFDYGAFGKISVDYGGNTGCDSWSSASATCTGASPVKTGPSCYTATKGSSCGLGTDGSASGAMTIHGSASDVYGNVYAGAASAITLHGNPNITGANGQIPTPLSTPTVVPPGTGSTVPSCAGCTPATNTTYTTMSGNVTIGPGTYVVGTLSASLTIASGPVLIYVTTSFSPTVTNNTGVPSNVIFMLTSGVSSASIPGGFMGIYAPDTALSMHANGDVYGAVVGSTITISGTPAIHYDTSMATAVAGGYNCVVPPTEVSRSSPVVATITPSSGGPQTAIVQGSFESPSGTPTTINTVASIATFAFPFEKGHMRGRVASTITNAGSTFSSGTVLFDVGAPGNIPPVVTAGCTTYNGTCRHVFTNTNAAAPTGTTFHPTVATLDDGHASTIGALIAPTSIVSGITSANWQTIVRTVLAGPLGGVDRSTAAVIQASSAAGVTTRPTVAYFGATDGMLHAVCASIGGTTPSQSSICPSLGTELWAFIPRVQLPSIRTNTARIDGSVRVVDVFGDFVTSSADGRRSWHTILTFQTGSNAAAYALDITDPANPIVLWEYVTPTTPSTTDFGTGLVVAAGPAAIKTQLVDLAVLETTNGGTGGTGIATTALSQETGAKLWQFGYLYPAPPRGVAADLPMASTGIPGGAVAVDLVGFGYLSDFVFGDLYGNLWRVDATSGTSRNGIGLPLFSFATNKHPIGEPPTIYSSGGEQYAAFSSGGYADPTATSWTTNPQYVIAVKLSVTGATISDTASPCVATCALSVKQTLVSGDKGVSQSLVVGSQLFVTTDSADVNAASYGTATNTGHLLAIDLTGVVASTTVVINSGASSLVNAGTALYSSSSTQQQQIASSANGVVGAKVDPGSTPSVQRTLWLRTQ